MAGCSRSMRSRKSETGKVAAAVLADERGA